MLSPLSLPSLFLHADTVIKGDNEVVSAPAFIAPVTVRYGWASKAQGGSLPTAAGLPVSPLIPQE